MLSPTQIRQFRDQGYFITDIVFSEAELLPVRREFQGLWDASIRAAESLDEKTQELTRFRPFFGGIHKQSEICARFCRQPVFLSLCQELIGPDADLYFNQAVMKPPQKGKSFAWHQDTQYIVTE